MANITKNVPAALETLLSAWWDESDVWSWDKDAMIVEALEVPSAVDQSTVFTHYKHKHPFSQNKLIPYTYWDIV